MTLSKGVFSNFMPNYKDLATIGQIFSSLTSIKSRVLLENKVVERLMNKENPKEEMQPIDNIVYKTFVSKFNEQYAGKLTEQQQALLSHYISSFADNGLQLKTFLNEELTRLKKSLSKSLNIVEISRDDEMADSTKKIIAKLEEYKNTPIDKIMLESILKTQELVKEIES
jgi:exonuclease I